MKRLLKHYFVPHEGNDHKPHMLRPKTLGLIALVVITLEAGFLLHQAGKLPGSHFLASVLPNVLVDQTNDQRVDSALGVLRTNPVLERAAQAKANDMAAKGYFSHNTPDGKDPWYWFKEAGYTFTYAGENLAVNFTESTDVTRAWMNSPNHRANIVSDHFTEVGIAIAQGIYNGKEATFVVQLFGTPALSQFTREVTPAAATKPNAQVPKPRAAQAPKPAPLVATTPNAVAVKGAEVQQADVALSEPTETLPPVETGPVSQASSLEKIAAAPKTSVRDLFIAFGALIALALLIKLIVSATKHPRQYAHGMAVIALIGCALAINGYVSFRSPQILGDITHVSR